MALINKRYDVSQLGEFGESGFGAASFPEIKDAIARKMMEIYGNDIDISSASADGQYIMMEALIVNNMYRSLENIVRNLNPASASGGYLDILASFSGAFRQQPTYSKAQLYIWNTSANALTPDQIVCVDKNGNQWKWINPIDWQGNARVTIPSNVGNDVPFGPLTFECTRIGAVEAFGYGEEVTDWSDIRELDPRNRGCDIFQTLDLGDFDVFQKENAVVGHGIESDASLRARRTRSFGEGGATILNSLNANLLAIDGLDDCWVFNNATGSSVSMTDGTSVASHNVYVVVWKDPTLNINDPVFDDAVGSTIYDQITPGVLTEPFIASRIPEALAELGTHYIVTTSVLTELDLFYVQFPGASEYCYEYSDSGTIPANTIIIFDGDNNYDAVGSYAFNGTVVSTSFTNNGEDTGSNPYIALAITGPQKSWSVQINDNLWITHYWKQAIPASPQFKFELTLRDGVTALTSEQQTAIEQAIYAYLNNVKLGESVSRAQLIAAASAADFRTQPYGLPSYDVTGVAYGSDDTEFTTSMTLPLTRFYYTDPAMWASVGTTVTVEFGSGDWPVVS